MPVGGGGEAAANKVQAPLLERPRAGRFCQTRARSEAEMDLEAARNGTARSPRSAEGDLELGVSRYIPSSHWLFRYTRISRTKFTLGKKL